MGLEQTDPPVPESPAVSWDTSGPTGVEWEWTGASAPGYLRSYKDKLGSDRPDLRARTPPVLPGPAQPPRARRPQAVTGRDRPCSAPPDPNASGPTAPGPAYPSGPRAPRPETGPAQVPRPRTPSARPQPPLTAAPGSPAPSRPVSAGA